MMALLEIEVFVIVILVGLGGVGDIEVFCVSWSDEWEVFSSESVDCIVDGDIEAFVIVVFCELE
jgi:hypothetical protein